MPAPGRIDIAAEAIDYKNPDLLKKFVTESGKNFCRGESQACRRTCHRKITAAENQTQPFCAADEVM